MASGSTGAAFIGHHQTSRSTLRRIVRSSFVRAVSLGVALNLAAPAAVMAAPSSFKSDEAQALYDAGIQKFDRGEFEDALVDLDASIEVERSALALYAKAQSLNKLERCREAVPIYNEVLGMLPEDSGARPAVKDALVTCAEKMAEEDETPLPPPVIDTTDPEVEDDLDDPPEEIDRPNDKQRKKWYTDPYAPILIGVGAVGVGIGGYYLAEASEENARQPEQYDEFAAKGERVRQLQVRGGVILGVGGALLLTGVIRYAILAAKGRRSKTAFAPSVGPRWAGASLSGRF